MKKSTQIAEDIYKKTGAGFPVMCYNFVSFTLEKTEVLLCASGYPAASPGKSPIV